MANQVIIKVFFYRGRFQWLQKLLCFSFCRSVADHWDEVPKKAALAYASEIFLRLGEIYEKADGKQMVKNEGLYHAGRSSVLFFLLGIRWWIWKLIHKEVIHSLLEEFRATDFFFASNPIKNFIPYIKRKRFGKLYGPENFDVFRGSEFAFADGMYIQYRQGDAEALDKLIAVLYRPEKANYDPSHPSCDGDQRESFNMHTVDWRLPDVARLKPAEKALIVLWYAGNRHIWTEMFPNVFPKKEASENEEESAEVAGANWIDTLRNLAGGKFGDMENTMKYNMYLILCEAEDLIKQAKEARRNKNGL